MKRKDLLLANQSQTGIASLFLARKLKVFAKKSGICFNPPSSVHWQERTGRVSPLAVNFVMTADIEKHNLLMEEDQCQGDAVTVGQAAGMATRELAGR